jgi:N-acetyl-anhydromuramyl-L-alanine amidase AmpD
MTERLFSPSSFSVIPSQEESIIAAAFENVVSTIQRPSDKSNYNDRKANGIVLNNDEEASAIVDTFIIHDPGFQHPDNPESVKAISLERQTEITLDEVTLPGKKKSAHFTMDNTGLLYQHVPLHKRAWHAGVSSLHGVQGLNTTSIGIEVVGPPYTEIQYMTLAFLIHRTSYIYNRIIPGKIVGHNMVSPGRKLDPMQFDWWKLFTDLIYVRGLEGAKKRI